MLITIGHTYGSGGLEIGRRLAGQNMVGAQAHHHAGAASRQ